MNALEMLSDEVNLIFYVILVWTSVLEVRKSCKYLKLIYRWKNYLNIIIFLIMNI